MSEGLDINSDLGDQIFMTVLKKAADTLIWHIRVAIEDLATNDEDYKWEDLFNHVRDLEHINGVLDYYGEERIYPQAWKVVEKSKKKAKGKAVKADVASGVCSGWGKRKKGKKKAKNKAVLRAAAERFKPTMKSLAKRRAKGER